MRSATRRSPGTRRRRTPTAKGSSRTTAPAVARPRSGRSASPTVRGRAIDQDARAGDQLARREADRADAGGGELVGGGTVDVYGAQRRFERPGALRDQR